MSWHGQRVLITGGRGYLGRHLEQGLRAAGAEIFSLDVRPSDGAGDFHADISKPDEVVAVVKRTRPDTVFHLAAVLDRERSFERHRRIMDVNYFGTFHVLEALQESKCRRLVFTSTSEIYGGNAPPFRENQQPDPASPYSLSKVFSEQLLRTYGATHDVPYVVLRLFNFFGAGMPEDFFVPQLTRALRENGVFDMTEGAQARDYLHVDDVVRALMLAGRHEAAVGETFNVCSGQSTTLRDLVDAFRKLLGSTSEVKYGALPYRKNEVWNMIGDPGKISNLLGFTPHYSLEEAIIKTLQDS